MAMCGVGGKGALHPMTAQQGDQIRLDPCAKLGGRDTTSIVLIAIQKAEDLVGQEFCNDSCHAGEAVDEEVDGISTIKVERGACTILCVGPGIEVVQPCMSMSERRKKRDQACHTHIDQHDA